MPSDKTTSILRTLRASFFSSATLDFIRKNAELTGEVFANPTALPITPCFVPANLPTQVDRYHPRLALIAVLAYD